MKSRHQNVRKSSHRPAAPARRHQRSTAHKLSPMEADIERKARTAREEAGPTLPFGMQETREVKISEIKKERDEDTYSPMGLGMPDGEPLPDIDNPAGVQGGRGPLNEEGEGNRQNDEAAELEEIEPDLDPFQSSR